MRRVAGARPGAGSKIQTKIQTMDETRPSKPGRPVPAQGDLSDNALCKAEYHATDF